MSFPVMPTSYRENKVFLLLAANRARIIISKEIMVRFKKISTVIEGHYLAPASIFDILRQTLNEKFIMIGDKSNLQINSIPRVNFIFLSELHSTYTASGNSLSRRLLHIYVNISAVFLITLVVVCYFLLLFAFRFPFPCFVVRFLLDILPLVFAAATILNIFPPHTVHFPEMPLRPFFVLTRFSSLISRITLHFIQYPSVVNLPYFSCLDIRLVVSTHGTSY